MKREISLEQFYTSSENVNFCLEKIDLSKYDLIIEPSAGNGSFSSVIPNCIAYDIAPKNINIIKQDFLLLDTKQFSNKKILTVGNPPFGRQSSLAIKFINKAAEFSNTIAFILPKSFKKESILSRLNEHLFLESVYELPNTLFNFEDKTFDIPCSFFIFIKKEQIRKKESLPVVDDFSFVDKENADCSIRRVGFYAGKIEGLNVSKSSHYFIKWNTTEAKNNYLKLKFDFDNTVGARSLSKSEIIKKYYNTYLCK